MQSAECFGSRGAYFAFLILTSAFPLCRVPERYRTRVPFNIPEREVAQATFICMEALSQWKRLTGDVFFCSRSPISGGRLHAANDIGDVA